MPANVTSRLGSDQDSRTDHPTGPGPHPHQWGRGRGGGDPYEAHERDGGRCDVEHDGEHGDMTGAFRG